MLFAEFVRRFFPHAQHVETDYRLPMARRRQMKEEPAGGEIKEQIGGERAMATIDKTGWMSGCVRVGVVLYLADDKVMR